MCICVKYLFCVEADRIFHFQDTPQSKDFAISPVARSVTSSKVSGPAVVSWASETC